MQCDTAQVVITVLPVNDPPVAVDDVETTNEDVSISVDVLDLGTPDSDTESNILITTAGSAPGSIDNTGTQGGTLSINDNGTPADSTDDFIDYTPMMNFFGNIGRKVHQGSLPGGRIRPCWRDDAQNR